MVKVPILQHLESLRDEELEERREKRRRQLAEEEESKQNERRASGAEQAREQSLQVGKLSSESYNDEFSNKPNSSFSTWVCFLLTQVICVHRVLAWGPLMVLKTLQVMAFVQT